MSQTATIFVQIPAYRDPECLPTIEDLFEQAEHPERISVGVCWQYMPEVENHTLALPDPIKSRVNIIAIPATESKGVGWARHEAQKFYNGENFTLMIDCHSRFAKHWDTILIEQLRQCSSEKPVLSGHPAEYDPTLASTLKKSTPNVIRANYPTPLGDIRFHSEMLEKAAPKPLKGAFVTSSCLFAEGKLINEIPSDPHLYFEQEELCYSARLYTHGWDVFHPINQVVHHLYESVSLPYIRHKHWLDNSNWSTLNQYAVERRRHLLGNRLAESENALADLETFGHGQERSLDEYANFCGINFSTGEVTSRALSCGFIEDLKKFRSQPIRVMPPQQPKPEQASDSTEVTIINATNSRRIESPYVNIPASNFKPKSIDILSTEIYQPLQIPKRSVEPKLITEGVPPGVLLIENYASPELCKFLTDHSERTLGLKLNVVDTEQSVGDKIVIVESEARQTEYVSFNDICGEVLNVFIDIYTQRLAPFFGVKFEWFERPQILRYRPGGKYDPHADADDIDKKTGKWIRVHDRDISVLLYLNEGYEGGKISFETFNYSIQPKAGMLIAFPSDHRYIHAALPTTSGVRYVIVSWSTYLKTIRVKNLPPYASIILHSPNE